MGKKLILKGGSFTPTPPTSSHMLIAKIVGDGTTFVNKQVDVGVVIPGKYCIVAKNDISIAKYRAMTTDRTKSLVSINDGSNSNAELAVRKIFEGEDIVAGQVICTAVIGSQVNMRVFHKFTEGDTVDLIRL